MGQQLLSIAEGAVVGLPQPSSQTAPNSQAAKRRTEQPGGGQPWPRGWQGVAGLPHRGRYSRALLRLAARLRVEQATLTRSIAEMPEKGPLGEGAGLLTGVLGGTCSGSGSGSGSGSESGSGSGSGTGTRFGLGAEWLRRGVVGGCT